MLALGSLLQHTNFMITVASLVRMADTLHAYDVRDGGWEQEPKGVEANMKHVSTHLSKDIALKDFTDLHNVQTAIAPDLVQYALRFARWTGQTTQDLLYPSIDTNIRLSDYEKRFASNTSLHVATIGALSLMNETLHDLDHERTRGAAIEELPAMARRAGGMMLTGVHCTLLAEPFDLEGAFDTRILGLRERFGVIEQI